MSDPKGALEEAEWSLRDASLVCKNYFKNAKGDYTSAKFDYNYESVDSKASQLVFATDLCYGCSAIYTTQINVWTEQELQGYDGHILQTSGGHEGFDSCATPMYKRCARQGSWAIKERLDYVEEANGGDDFKEPLGKWSRCGLPLSVDACEPYNAALVREARGELAWSTEAWRGQILSCNRVSRLDGQLVCL
mmetsp:Transcript_21025/g.31188  ORF Transcript_21025/g.31188 Transcript_21025/m.31188 type:complete len:192 (-) Transcript_21025:742-1317(-)